MRRFRLPALVLAAMTSAHAANLTGLWEFDDSGNLGKATVGTNLTFQGTAPTWSATMADDQGDHLTGVITSAAAAKANQIIAAHGIAANGGGSYVNRYTIVMDLFSPAAYRSSWRTIFQTNQGNSNDADYFINPSDQIGVAELGYSGGTINETSWTRLAITVDLSSGGAGVKTYLDGSLFHTHSTPALDGRFALDPTLLFLSDNDGDNAPLNVGAIAIYDDTLTATEVTDLGGAGTPLLHVPGQSPTLTVQAATSSPIIAKASTQFSFLATDPENSAVRLQVDWGNGEVSPWTAAGPSGVAQAVTYAYPYAGDFTIRARACDAYGGTSDWTNIQSLTVTRAAGIPDALTGLWDFAYPADLGHATYGANLSITGTAPTYEATRADVAAESSTLIGVITTAAGAGNHLVATHGIAANGYGTKTNDYTLVFDVLIPGTGQWRSFYQTAAANNNDAEYFVRNSDNTLGRLSMSYTTTPAPAGRWMRLTVTADLQASGAFRTYIDGVLFHTHTKPALDSDFALDPTVLLFGDEDGENQPLVIGMVASFARALTAGEVADLGGCGSAIIAESNNQVPALTLQTAGPAATGTGISQTYSFLPGDPDGDPVQVQTDWGDGTTSAWTTLSTPGTTRTINHAWSSPGTFTLRARSRDSRGGLSAWTTLQDVVVTGVAQVTFSTPPYLQNMSTTGMVVMAEVVENVPLKVAYGTSEALGFSADMTPTASGGGTYYHRGIITGLAPGTTYHYVIAAEDGTPLTADATFRTAPAGREDFSFTALGDSQTTNSGAWDADPWEPTKTMFQHMLSQGTAFGLGIGDESNDGSSYSTTKSAHLNRMCTILGSKVPFFIAWGNHDGSSPDNPVRLSADLPSRYRAGLSPGHGNYTFTYSDVFFVCLDVYYFNNEIGAGAWLENELSSPAARNARFRVLSVHYPPYCERWLDGDATLRTQLVPLMEQYHVNLCLSGHTHEYERGFLNGVNYVICGGGSYLDHAEAIVTDWQHMTVGGAQNVPGFYAQQSSFGVLGSPQPIIGGLFHHYVQVTVRENFLRLDCHAFNANGSYIGILDSFSIGSDPGPDTDGDGMRDPWELANGLSPNVSTGVNGPAGDLDGDGQSNLSEMIAGTAANNPSSVLKTTDLTATPGGVRVTWTSVPGKRYTIETSADLRSWLTVMDGASPLLIDASAGATTTQEISLPSAARGFVRVGATAR